METEEKTIDEGAQGNSTMVESPIRQNGRKLYIESYGCAMNFSDSEIIASVMANEGYVTTTDQHEADVVLLNTCSIRDKAEQTVRKRLSDFKKRKKSKPNLVIGVLGCMAERLKTQLLDEEKLVDLIAGPDSYRDLPSLVSEVDGGQKAVNVLLSREETYAEISPIRLNSNGITAFISIMRGCDNMCAFCVVPFTRGRERSRDPASIVKEAQELVDQGYKEVTLLGQNVDSYRWNISHKGEVKDQTKPTTNFAQLMEMVALVNPGLRIRFSTSHPKDMTDDVLHVIAKYENICNYVHLPVQSGSTEVLKRMNRGYTRDWYLNRINAIRKSIPGCSISTDIIAGFCGETEEQHKETLSLMEEVQYDYAFNYFYSERPKTLAERKFEDDVPEDVKKKRLAEIIVIQRASAGKINKTTLGKIYKVLVEGYSKKSKEHLFGRNSKNAAIVFPKENYKPGDYVNVKIEDCTTATLLGTAVELIN
jgi:tRNA-2-methylthio-N6-dimethylallyladenosine synthase